MRSRHRSQRKRIWWGAAGGLATVGLVIGAVAQAAQGSASTQGQGTAGGTAVSAPVKPALHTLQADFTMAAAEFHVPSSVLLAVSYQQTLWESHRGSPSVTGNYNVMGLTSVSRTDLRAASDSPPETNGRGDDPRAPHHPAATPSDSGTVPPITPAMRTLDTAASILGDSPASLRTSTRQSVRGAAALLASYERAATGSLPTTSAQWYPAVARFSQAANPATADQFAHRVYGTIRTGAHRITADNQEVTLTADPSVPVQASPKLSPDLKSAAAQASDAVALNTAPRSGVAHARAAVAPLSPRTPVVKADTTTTTPATECPSTLTCTFTPAAYALNGSTDQTDYGNYDLANRPADGDAITSIVIHDTESTASAAINAFQKPSSYASAHYVVGADGSVTQMVPTKDVAWHAGNKYVNDHSIGIEHEGYALDYGSWYTEQEYQSSAALVTYLAQRFAIPLDREHLIGHDDVPGPLDAYYEGMHWDPGPWWNWGHYLALLQASPNGDGMPVAGGEVTITPPWSTANEPTLTGCGSSTTTCPANPANFVYLRTSPSSTASLIKDPKYTADGQTTGSTLGWDWTDKAVYGQTFVVAAVQGDWTAIWFDGQKAWFSNPGGAYTMANTGTAKQLITPAGTSAVPVYGRAYPETSAYPSSLSTLAADPNQQLTPLSHETVQPGQAYRALDQVTGDFYYAENLNCTADPDCLLVVGTTQYYPIRYNHRIAYVKASDVRTIQPVVPPTGTFKPVTPTRIMDTRSGTGVTKAKVGPAGTVRLQVAGMAGVPSSGVTGVVVNVTATGGTSSSYVTVYPDGSPRPAVSNLNFSAGETFPNLVVVPVVDGKVDFYNNAGSVNLVADITGYYSSSGSVEHNAGPLRVMDTRNGTGVRKGTVGATAKVTLTVGGRNGVPVNATAVVLNVTATGGTSSSYVTVYPDGTTRSSASNLNFTAGETIPNLVVVPVINGKVDFYNNAGSVHLIADLTGYYTS
ncbi:N-acetylmuramoyl-L-alanine amidase [Streptomyces canus]|uniref:N-acetylmuramoyl-L-alanine amidase n=1 Tax=Streptomyces canus TaxID=58343 RepID=UPI0036EDB858